MKNVVRIVLMAVLVFGCKEKTKETTEEMVKEPMVEVASPISEWTFLFDGTSFDGWKGYLTNEVPEHWKLEDGAMVFHPPKTRKEGEAYNLVTKASYTDFVLSLEWKIAAGGNSGIFYGVKEDPSLPEAYQTGPEIQVLDNDGHPDGKNGKTHQAGALYDMVAPSKDLTKPIGEWNNCIIMVNHKTNEGSVSMNGEVVLVFPTNDPEWSAMVAKSKFANWAEFGKYATGKIGLQDHGDGVSFRNIKIKEL